LAVGTRRIEPDFVGAVIIDADATDQRIDMVAVGNGIHRPLEQDHRDAFSANHAVRRRIERLYMAIAREVHPLLIHIAQLVGIKDRRCTHQGLLRFAGEQIAIGGIDGHQ
jgi:hypothetical protein